jgi:predicted nuclease of predicted toxin-antitoxin system
MRILLDECAPRPIVELLSGYDCTPVQQRGWMGIRNTDLLRLAGNEFDVFITCDEGFNHQQHLQHSPLAILELSTSDLRRIRLSAPAIASAVSGIRPREYLKLLIS